MSDDAGQIAALLDFWFGAPGTEEHNLYRQSWFRSSAEHDATLRQLFGADHARAAAGGLDHWAAGCDGALALVLLLDQLPRNLNRGSAEAFACDAKARATARHALAQGCDRDMPPMRRLFLYLPFEHSEALADQELSFALFASLPPCAEKAQIVDSARKHRAVITRFGRFPHRNAALGRASTAVEVQFLGEPGSSF